MKVKINESSTSATTFTLEPENAQEVELLKARLPKLARQSCCYFTHHYSDPCVYLTVREPSRGD